MLGVCEQAWPPCSHAHQLLPGLGSSKHQHRLSVRRLDQAHNKQLPPGPGAPQAASHSGTGECSDINQGPKERVTARAQGAPRSGQSRGPQLFSRCGEQGARCSPVCVTAVLALLCGSSSRQLENETDEEEHYSAMEQKDEEDEEEGELQLVAPFHSQGVPTNVQLLSERRP